MVWLSLGPYLKRNVKFGVSANQLIRAKGTIKPCICLSVVKLKRLDAIDLG